MYPRFMYIEIKTESMNYISYLNTFRLKIEEKDKLQGIKMKRQKVEEIIERKKVVTRNKIKK